MAVKAIERKEVWYWPEKDQLIHALFLGRDGWLMFFGEGRYYFHPIDKKDAKKAGFLLLGKI